MDDILNLNISEYRVFHHITEKNPVLCISGHKAKLFSCLFNIRTHEILKLGTSYCKKHGLLKEHLKNDFLITILREIVESGKTNDSGNWILSKTELEERINKHFLYFRNLFLENFLKDSGKSHCELENIESENIEPNKTDYEYVIYYDFYLPLIHFKNDILEIINIYGNSEGMNDILENIERLIEKIMNFGKFEKYMEESLVDESFVDESLVEESLVDESLVDESLVEESLVDESLVDESLVEESLVEESLVEVTLDKIKNDILKLLGECSFDENNILEKQEIETEYSLNKLNPKDTFERIKILKKNIENYKIDFDIFTTNLQHLQKNIETEKYKIQNNKYQKIYKE